MDAINCFRMQSTVISVWQRDEVPESPASFVDYILLSYQLILTSRYTSSVVGLHCDFAACFDHNHNLVYFQTVWNCGQHIHHCGVTPVRSGEGGTGQRELLHNTLYGKQKRTSQREEITKRGKIIFLCGINFKYKCCIGKSHIF